MDLCNERYDRVDDRLSKAEKTIDSHRSRIGNLEQFRSSTEIEIKNLVKQIGDLVSVIKWFMGLLATSMIGFFIWYVQML